MKSYCQSISLANFETPARNPAAPKTPNFGSQNGRSTQREQVTAKLKD